MKIQIITFLIALTPLTIFAQSKFLANKDEMHILSERVAKSFYETKPHVGLNELKDFRFNNYLPENITEMQYGSISMVFQKNNYLYQEPQTYFLSSEKELGEVGKKLTYIIQYSREIIKLTFIYLKSDEGWYLDSFDMSDEYKSEFN